MMKRIEDACFFYGKVLNKRAITIKATEEAGEIIQALSKLSLKFLSEELGESFWVDESEEYYLLKVYEEMIDVYFMILQLKTTLGRNDIWDELCLKKIERAEKRIDKKMKGEY